MVLSRSVDSKVIKEAIESAVGPIMTKMTSALCFQKRAMEEMSMELFRKNMGHQQEDREWTEVEEALRNWCNWGRLGTRYGHLPVVEERMLRRVDSLEASGSGMVSEDELLELKRTRRAVRELPPPTPREAYLPQRPGWAHKEGMITSRASSASNQRGSQDKAVSQGESKTRRPA